MAAGVSAEGPAGSTPQPGLGRRRQQTPACDVRLPEPRGPPSTWHVGWEQVPRWLCARSFRLQSHCAQTGRQRRQSGAAGCWSVWTCFSPEEPARPVFLPISQIARCTHSPAIFFPVALSQKQSQSSRRVSVRSGRAVPVPMTTNRGVSREEGGSPALRLSGGSRRAPHARGFPRRLPVRREPCSRVRPSSPRAPPSEPLGGRPQSLAWASPLRVLTTQQRRAGRGGGCRQPPELCAVPLGRPLP